MIREREQRTMIIEFTRWDRRASVSVDHEQIMRIDEPRALGSPEPVYVFLGGGERIAVAGSYSDCLEKWRYACELGKGNIE